MNSKVLTALLVEDEPLCRSDFRQILKSFPEVKLLGEAVSLTTAQEFLIQKNVDLLFLDVSLGNENGLDLLDRLSAPPMVVALTAHAEYAARGFSQDLVDYILKPIEPARLRTALHRVHHRKSLTPAPSTKTSFVVEKNGQKGFLELAEILRAESMGNYVLFHTPQGKAIQRATFRHVERKLPERLFLRFSRGRMVARHQIRSWHRDGKGRLHLLLASGDLVRVSRSQSPAILRDLEGKL